MRNTYKKWVNVMTMRAKDGSFIIYEEDQNRNLEPIVKAKDETEFLKVGLGYFTETELKKILASFRKNDSEKIKADKEKNEA